MDLGCRVLGFLTIDPTMYLMGMRISMFKLRASTVG